MIKERRRHARLRIPLEAEYRIAGEELWRQGTIWTLGAGGAALLCDEKLDEGTVLDGLHFVVAAEGDLPETRIEVGAEVVHVDREGDFGCRSCFMLGLQFRGLGEEEFELLRQFVFRRLTGAQPPAAAAAAQTGETAGETAGQTDGENAGETAGETAGENAAAPPIEIRFRLFEEFVAEVSENLSPTGMFIRAHRPLPPGSNFTFQFQLGDDFSLFQGTAEVVWTRRRGEGPDRPPGMGVRFLELDPTSRGMVRRLVDQRAALEAAGPGAPAAEPPPAPVEAVAETEVPRFAEEPPMPVEALVALGPPEDAAQTADGPAGPSAERQLEERLAEAEAAGGEARERLAQLEADTGGLRQELLAERSARAEAESAREQAESAAEELRGELEAAARNAREELVRRQAEWGALETELRERLDRSEAGRADLERLAERAEGAESDLDRLRQESTEARRDWEALDAELRAQLERQGAEREDLEDRLAQAVGATTELRERLGELRQTRDELEERVARGAKVEAALREQAHELRAAPAELEARLDRATEKLHRLRSAAEAMRTKLNGDLGAARSLESDLADRLAEVAAVGSSLDEKLGGLSAARAGLGDRLARLVDAWSDLEQGLAETAPEDLDGGGPPEPALAEPVSEEAEAVPIGAAEAPVAEVGESAVRPEPPTGGAEGAAVEPEGPEVAAPTAAARLVGAARRAAARLGLARGAAAGGNGSAPEPATSEAVVDAGPSSPDDPAGADAIERTIRAWAAAWSERRVEDYLAFYSRDFEPVALAEEDAGAGSPAWLPPLDGMELSLGPISQTELSPGRFAVHFEQRVTSDSYARRTGRTLELVREADAWKIAAESFQDL